MRRDGSELVEVGECITLKDAIIGEVRTSLSRSPESDQRFASRFLLLTRPRDERLHNTCFYLARGLLSYQSFQLNDKSLFTLWARGEASVSCLHYVVENSYHQLLFFKI